MSLATRPRRNSTKRGSFRLITDLTDRLLPTSDEFYELSPLHRANQPLQQAINGSSSEGYGYDLVIVVPNPDSAKYSNVSNANHTQSSFDEYSLTFHAIMERLALANFQTYLFYSNDEDKSMIFIKLKAGLDILMKHAEDEEYPMRVNEEYAKTFIDIARHPIAHNPAITRMLPYEHVYIKYTIEKRAMFQNSPGLTHPFSSTLRIKLMLSIISDQHEGCCSMNLDKLVASKSILSYYPLHDSKARDLLAKHWFPWHVAPWHQPTEEIKDYLGDKIGLYYTFLGFYSTWLIPLSIGGVIVVINLVIEAGYYNNVDEALLSGYLIPFYCVFTSLWSCIMLEYWRRTEVRKAMEWGQTQFEETEDDRPQFIGEYIPSIINGRRTKYFSPEERNKRVLYSLFITSLMMVVVVSSVSVIFLAQYYVDQNITDDAGKSGGNSFTSIASAVQIVVLKYLYQGIALNLTNNENHRTDTDFEDSLILKLFAFNFVNSFASLVYVAFIKSSLEPCTGPCFVELSYQLTTIFVTALIVDKAQKFILFYGKRYYKAQEIEKLRARRNLGPNWNPSPAERDFILDDYNPLLDTIENYSEIATQFGFVTLFVAAFPLAPLLAYFSNIIEIRSDGYSMLYTNKRVIPNGGEDIGSWFYVLQIISYASIITNAALLCFTTQLVALSGVGKVWVFIVFQYVMILCLLTFSFFIKKVPLDVDIQLKRQDYLSELAFLSAEDREMLEKPTKENFSVISPSHTSGIFTINDFDE